MVTSGNSMVLESCLCISKTLKIMGLEATEYETVKVGLLGHAGWALFSTAVCQFKFEANKVLGSNYNEIK